MAVQGVRFTRRVGALAMGFAAAVALAAGCSSSSGGHPAAHTSSTGAGTTTTTSAGAGSGTTSSGGGGGAPLGSAFCAGFNAGDLAKLQDPKSLGQVGKVWDQFAADAPSEIKPQVQDIDKYIHDVINGNYSAIQQNAAKIGQDAQAVGAYFAAHCHA